MTEAQPSAPGHDQIMVAAVAERTVCHARGHARLGVLAEVVVTFGELGTRWGNQNTRSLRATASCRGSPDSSAPASSRVPRWVTQRRNAPAPEPIDATGSPGGPSRMARPPGPLMTTSTGPVSSASTSRFYCGSAASAQSSAGSKVSAPAGGGSPASGPRGGNKSRRVCA